MPRSFHPDPVRTRVLAERWGSWILPHWLERQADPASQFFVPAPPTGGIDNVSIRDRFPLGVLDSPVQAGVDPRGLVTPGDGRWSLDWWVGADDRWHLPSREVGVRQRAIDGAPVVETAMRVPGGDVIHRAWAFHDVTVGEVLAVEIENAGRVPVAIALSLRPYGPEGAGQIGRIEVTGTHISIDGQLALWLPKPPARVSCSNLARGDVSIEVLSGGSPDVATASVDCDAGFAQAAVIVPLAHTATFRVLIPLRPGAAPGATPSAVPPPDATARGWITHVSQAVRLEMPDPELAELFMAAGTQVLLASAGLALTGESPTTETASIVGALDRLGLHDEAAAIVATVAMGQGSGGRLGGTDPADEATSAALVATGRHWRMARDTDLMVELAGPLAAGAHHHRHPGGLRALRDRLLGSGGSTGPVDLGWRLRALLDVADALRGGGQPEAAAEVGRLAQEAQLELDAALAQGRDHRDGPMLSSTSDRRLDGAAADALALVAPLGVVDATDPAAVATLDWVREHLLHHGGVAQVVGPTGLSPVLTSLVGRVELRRGERSALDRLDWLVRAAGPTRTFPELIHPRLGTGCNGGGWSPVAAAAFLELVLDLFVHESHDGTGLVLCPVWPMAWLGAGVEVHDLPTTFGPLSFAVRWHGARPALLWELVPHDPASPVHLTIPGLDPTWSTDDARGDALLAEPAIAAETNGAELEVDQADGTDADGTDADGTDADCTELHGANESTSGPGEGESFA